MTPGIQLVLYGNCVGTTHMVLYFHTEVFFANFVFRLIDLDLTWHSTAKTIRRLPFIMLEEDPRCQIPSIISVMIGHLGYEQTTFCLT